MFRLRSLIGCLFCDCGPSAIFRLIVAVIVDAVNAMCFGWASTHIRNKSCETVAPSLTHFYASAAIINIGMVLRVGASCNYAAPHGIFRSFPPLARGSMGSCRSISHYFAEKATATAGITTLKFVAFNKCCVAAIAQTFPTWMSFSLIRYSFDHIEPLESLACKVAILGMFDYGCIAMTQPAMVMS